jgi:CBS-domain-containing membrane protein
VTTKNLIAYFFPRQGTLSHQEKFLSSLGAFAAVLVVALVSHFYSETAHFPILAASMGASTILLLAAPHNPVSQPWPLLGGHLVAALVGITCAKFVPHLYLAAALAVAFTVAIMLYLRCLHPPGGGTALLVVIGGPTISEMGYLFAFTPVLLNSALLLMVALLVNRLIPGRKYPYNLSLPSSPAAKDTGKDKLGFSHQDLQDALQEIDGYIDVTGEDLERIYALAMEHARAREGAAKEKTRPAA